MPQSIGTNAITGTTFNTQIPLLSETADITAALRLYHFGDSSYNLANTDPANLVNPSIAYTLYDLQSDIATLSANVGIAYSEYAAKGDILTTTGPGTVSTVQPLSLGSQGQVLTVNTATSTGLQWSTPYSQPTIGSTAIPGATTVTTIAGLTLTNPTVNAGSGVVVLPGSNTPAQTADGSIVWDLDSDLLTVGTGSGRKTMVDTDSTQTLTNKTLTSPVVTGLTLNDSSIVFEGATPDNFETTLTVTDPTADRTITIPNVTGTVVTTGDTGTITSTMILDGTILNADINASAAIAVSKLSASTISGVTLGNNLNALTISTGLSGTSYNGSSAVTLTIDSTVVTLTGSQTLTNKTLTTPVIDSISASAATGINPSLYANTTTGNISIGAGLTTGQLNIATVGTGVTPISIGHTNATIGLTGNTTVTGTLTSTAAFQATTGIFTGATLAINGGPPQITSSNTSVASIFTSNVNSILIGSSTIKSTLFPTDGTTTSAASGAGYMGMPQVTTAISRSFAATDAGKHIYITASGTTQTIPANGTVAFPIGTSIVVVNGSSVSTTIAITTDTLRLANSSSTGSRTLASNGMCTLLKITSTQWIASGNGLS
jgi:hypothetical protein